MTHRDLVVVGTGWYGLAAARVYLQFHPDDDVLVLDASASCGGTWAEDRLYPGLKSNNQLGTYEFPGFPMDPNVYGIQPGEHVPGTVLHRYLTDFARTYGVLERIRFSTKVETLQPASSGGWQLTTSNPDLATITTKKVILATGLTSTPNMPLYSGASTFGNPIFHSKEFCREAHTVGSTKQVTVVGGAKSAYDIAHAYVAAGAKVDLVIRPDGKGPVWISPARVLGGRELLERVVCTRGTSWFSPCPWGHEDGISTYIRSFLHGTWLGRWIVDKFWATLGGELVELNDFDSHPELKKLKPWNPPFWTASALGIHNYDEPFFDMVKAGKVHVHIANITHLTPGTVHLSDNTSLASDAIICATGWLKTPPIKFTGVSTDLDVSPTASLALRQQADASVLKLFPRLANQPKLNFTPSDANALRLYRFMIPPSHLSSGSIAFTGHISPINNAPCAHIQALWITAYFSNAILPSRLPTSQDEAVRQTMLHTQWGKWRYPMGYGASVPDFVFDAVPYCDMLLRDLGVRNWRKKTWVKELSEPYGPRDWAGVVDEWAELRREAADTGKGVENAHANGHVNGKAKGS